MKNQETHKVAKLLIENAKEDSFSSFRKKNIKIETRKIHTDYLVPEQTKYQREVILKRDFVFRNENEGVYKEDYIKNMFNMLHYNKGHYYLNRNQLSIDKNIPAFTSCQYPNLTIGRNELSQSTNHYIKRTNNKTKNNCQINLIKTYVIAKDKEKDNEKQNEEELTLSSDSIVKEKQDPHVHRVEKQLKIFKNLCKTYDFYDRENKGNIYNSTIYSPQILSNKRAWFKTQTPSKRTLTKNGHSNVSQFHLAEESSKKKKTIYTPKEVLSSKIFANKITQLRIASKKAQIVYSNSTLDK